MTPGAHRDGRVAMASLKERLQAESAGRGVTAEAQAAYEAMLAELRQSGFLDHALRAGQPFPDFLLPDAEGRLVARDDLLARGPLVVTFFRGTWCPYCAITLDALEAALARIAARGATLAAVTPETGGRALEAKRRHRAHYAVLADVDQGLGLACGVVFRAPERYRARLRGRGVDLAERQGHAGWFLPVPATFVVDRGGMVRWAFLDVDFTRRAEPDDVLAALAAL